MREHQLNSLPVVRLDSYFVPGVDLEQVANLAGVAYEEEINLSFETLLVRLQEINRAVSLIAEKLPPRELESQLPGRDRTVLELLNHVLELSEMFLETTATHNYTAQMADAEPSQLMSATKLRSALDRANERLDLIEVDSTQQVSTYYGDRSMHSVLNRFVWHVAQHLRQLIWFFGGAVMVTRQIDMDALLADLPVPDEVWD